MKHTNQENEEVAVYNAVIDWVTNKNTKQITADAANLNLGDFALRSGKENIKLVVLNEFTSWDPVDSREEFSERYRLSAYEQARTVILDRAPHLSNKIQECFSNFLVRNAASTKLPQNLSNHLKYVFLNQDQADKLFQYPSLSESWYRFYEKYPDSQGLMKLSKVGFNATASHALVFVTNSSGVIGGVGYYLLSHSSKNDYLWKICCGYLVFHSD